MAKIIFKGPPVVIVAEQADQSAYDAATHIFIGRADGRDNSDYDDLIARGVPVEYWGVDDKDRLVELKTVDKDVLIASKLLVAKIDRVKAFAQEVSDFVRSKYNDDQKLTILTALVEARAQGLVNQAAYFSQVWTWLNTKVLVYYYSKQDEITATLSLDELAAIKYDLGQFHSSDPGVKIRTGLAIPD